MRCLNCNYFDLSYTSDRTGNIRHYRCPNCDSKWIAAWRGDPLVSVFGEPQQSKRNEWAWVNAGAVLAVFNEQEIPLSPVADFKLKELRDGVDLVSVIDGKQGTRHAESTEVAFFCDGHYKSGFHMQRGNVHVRWEIEL